MDQQQKSTDSNLETIIKTIPGEFIGVFTLLKSFLGNENELQLFILGIILLLFIPLYSIRILNITAKTQIILMSAAFLVWLLLIAPDGADQVFFHFTNTTSTIKQKSQFLGGLIIVLQFVLPLLTKPKAQT